MTGWKPTSSNLPPNRIRAKNLAAEIAEHAEAKKIEGSSHKAQGSRCKVTNGPILKALGKAKTPKELL